MLQMVIKTPKWKTSFEEAKNYPPFSNHSLFWQPIILQQIKSNAPQLLERLERKFKIGNNIRSISWGIFFNL
jgi:hypothetical protein